jgi:hypothetical protein
MGIGCLAELVGGDFICWISDAVLFRAHLLTFSCCSRARELAETN